MPDYESPPPGTILQVPVSDPIPDEWVLMDGTLYDSARYPDFVTAMGITDATFNLPFSPDPDLIPDGRQYIIKIGTRDDEAAGSVEYQELQRIKRGQQEVTDAGSDG